MLSMAYARSELGLAPNLPKEFKWDEELIARKLKDVQRTTKIQVLKGNPLSDRWVAVYGRFETRPLQAVRAGSKGQLMGYGFGHLNSAPAQLVYSGETIHELKAR
jgi:hypothetical protein